MRFSIFVALSLATHWLFWEGFYRASKSWQHQALQQRAIEPLELTYAPESARQFVPATDPPSQAPEPDESPAPRFLSRDRQRVAQESQAAHKDYQAATENQTASSRQQDRPGTGSAQEGSSGLNIRPSFWGMVTPEDPAVKFAPSTSLQLPKVSTLSVDLPRDIQPGAFTVLNTDPMLHYSFFERFNQLSYHHWVEEVNSSYKRQLRRGQIVRSGTYSTIVAVLLDREGKVLDSQIQDPSGMDDFDQAFPKALWITGQIPNPPADLIDPDGQVRIRLLVTVQIHNNYHSRN